jgi:hypothetical protein
MQDPTTITTPPAAEDAPKPPKAVRYYRGDGSQFYPGIPARDLTEDEFAALSDEQKALVDGGHVSGNRVIDAESGATEATSDRLYSKTRPSARKE